MVMKSSSPAYVFVHSCIRKLSLEWMEGSWVRSLKVFVGWSLIFLKNEGLWDVVVVKMFMNVIQVKQPAINLTWFGALIPGTQRRVKLWSNTKFCCFLFIRMWFIITNNALNWMFNSLLPTQIIVEKNGLKCVRWLDGSQSEGTLERGPARLLTQVHQDR